jgi:hypothetical protein
MSELSVADDWDVYASIGTAHLTTTAKDVFVPAHQIASSAEAVMGTTGDRSNTGADGRNYGLITFVMAESVATYLGMAKGAFETFVDGCLAGGSLTAPGLGRAITR